MGCDSIATAIVTQLYQPCSMALIQLSIELVLVWQIIGCEVFMITYIAYNLTKWVLAAGIVLYCIGMVLTVSMLGLGLALQAYALFV